MFVAVLLAVSIAGCQTPEDSPTMKEARALNAETNEVGRKFHERIDMVREGIEAKLERARGDKAEALERALTKVNSLDDQYETWLSQQILLPGATCNHDHADGEHHHHHHGTSLDELSDQDHLALQKAIRAQLDLLEKELNSLTL